jgi:hypothetical protein
MSKDPINFSEDELAEMVQKQKQAKCEECMQKIRTLLDEYNCDLRFIETRTNGQVTRTAWAIGSLPDQ